MSLLEQADSLRDQVFHYLKDGRSMTDLQFARMLYIWKRVDDLCSNIAYDGYEESEEEKE